MLSYDKLKNKPREFLAATGLPLPEFESLLPMFEVAYERTYPPAHTYEGKARQRGVGGGAKGTLQGQEKNTYRQEHPPDQRTHGQSCLSRTNVAGQDA